MKNVLLTLLALAFYSEAYAVPVAINRRDVKFPTQQMIEKQDFTNPLASSTTRVVTNTAGGTSAAVATLSSFSAQPDLARNLEITPGGTTGDIESCDIVVTGTNYAGSTITETFSFSANQNSKVIGAEAFKTVTLVTFPADCESGGFAATWSIGIGEKLGLKRCVANAGDYLFSLLGGSKEGTGPTLVVDSDEMEKNTADFVGTMNGSNDFTLYFMQNFGCFD